MTYASNLSYRSYMSYFSYQVTAASAPLVSTEPRGYRSVGNDGGLTRGQRTWGKPDPRLFDAILPDFFEVDFVRVYDEVK